jgi:hypothetical protein
MKTGMIMALAFFASGAQAQVIDKPLPGNGDWKAAQVSGHDLFKTSACVAYVKSADGKSVLELYAPQLGEQKGVFTEATVQVVTKEAGFVRGVLSDAAGAVSFQLTLATTREERPSQGLLARFADRAKIIEMLKKAANAKLSLVNAKGKVLKSIAFSLKGSTKTIDGTISACQIMQ